MKRVLRELGDPCLRTVCKSVDESHFKNDNNYLKQLVDDMITAMKKANGAGIAANQIGENERVFIAYGTGDNPRYPYKPKFPLTVFVNPEIEVMGDDKIELWEGCLSVPGFRGQVERFARVRVNAFDINGNPFQVEAEGHIAGTLQHELSHLNGQLFPDIARKGSLGNESLITSSAFEQYYKDSFFAHAFKIRDQYPAEPKFKSL